MTIFRRHFGDISPHLINLTKESSVLAIGLVFVSKMNNYFKNIPVSMRKKYLIFISSVFLIGILGTVLFYNYVVDISTITRPEVNTIENTNHLKKPICYVGVISRYPPNIIFNGYQPIIDYLNQNDKYHFELKLSTSYSETVDQLINGNISVAFFGSLLYINAHKQYGIVPILKPLNEDHKPFFSSILFTRNNSGIITIKDIVGKKIALPSQESFSGNWLIKYELKKIGVSEKDLIEIKNFPFHQNVVFQVTNGNYDVGVVKDKVFKDYKNRDLKLVAYSEPVPGSPIVAAKNYDAEVIETIKSLLLKIDSTKPYYKNLVKNWDEEFIYGFVEANDSDYNPIRKYSGSN